MSELLLEGEYLEDLQRNGLRIIQSSDGYRFTADSVILAHFAADSPLTGTVVDLGTGNGVVLLLLSALCPQTKLVGVEIQEKAADMARRSVLINGLQSSIEIIQGDLRDISIFIRPDSVEAVVSNPPFIPLGAGPVNRSREIALARQELACTLEDVFVSANRILKGRGKFFLVHKPERLTDICCLGRKYVLEPRRMRLVLPRPDGAPNMVLVEFVKQALPGLKVMPPLILADKDGNPSPEIKTMYGAEK
jgi:tRNA1Val (adenine37-N6)-methyltransferase